MKRVPRPLVLAALTAALVLHGAGCSRVGNENQASDAIIAIKLISYDGQSVGDTTKDVTATILFDVLKRNNSTVFPGDPNLNAVSFTTITLTYDPPFTALSGSGVSSNVSFPLGSTSNKIVLDIMPEAAKVAAGAGAGLTLFAHLNGQDLLGRPVDLDTPLAITLIP